MGALPMTRRVGGPKPDYVVPDFAAAWPLTYLPNGWGVAIADITPALAAVMLEANREDNRNQRKGNVGRYGNDMREGMWRLTHQGIAFDRKGRLFDGQHRLRAAVTADAGFQSLVFFGAGNNEEMAVLDTGAGRSAEDASVYVLGERVAHAAIASIRGFLRGTARAKEVYTHAHVLAQIDKYRAAVWFNDFAFTHKDGKRAPAPVRAAVLRAFYHHDANDLDRFVGILVERLDPTQPRDKAAKMLRRFLTEGAMSRGIDRQREVYCKAQRAIAAYLCGEVMDKLYATEDDVFPLPTDAQIADRNALADSHAKTANQE